MADQQAVLWAKTVGLGSAATGRGLWGEAGDRDGRRLWHLASLPHMPLGLGELASLPSCSYCS